MQRRSSNVVTYIVVLTQQHSPLAVSDQRPANLRILELLHAQLAGESAIGLVIDILGRNGDRGVGQLAREQQVDGGRGNDDLGGRITFRRVEVVDDGLDGVGDSVPIMIASPSRLEPFPSGSIGCYCREIGLGRLVYRGACGGVLQHIHLEVSSDEEFARHCGVRGN
jgi:hypothetical protein